MRSSLVTLLTNTQDGKKKKVQHIVTPGGEFQDGARIIKAGRKQVNVFGNSYQRSSKLEKFRVAMDLPRITLKNFPDTRVAFIVILFCTLMANHFLLESYSGTDSEFRTLRNSVSEDDHRSMQEMEAVMTACFEYSTNEAQQSNANNNSILPWYRKVLLKYSEREEFEVMVLTRQPAGTSIKKWPRVTRKVKFIIEMPVL